MLGICLGLQSLAEVYGAVVTHAPELMHGKTSQVLHQEQSVLVGLPSPFTATRYHSLAVETDTVDLTVFDVTARTDNINTVKSSDWHLVGGTTTKGKTMMVAARTFHDFVACYAQVETNSNGELLLDEEAIRKLDIGPGDRVLAVPR